MLSPSRCALKAVRPCGSFHWHRADAIAVSLIVFDVLCRHRPASRARRRQSCMPLPDLFWVEGVLAAMAEIDGIAPVGAIYEIGLIGEIGAIATLTGPRRFNRSLSRLRPRSGGCVERSAARGRHRRGVGRAEQRGAMVAFEGLVVKNQRPVETSIRRLARPPKCRRADAKVLLECLHRIAELQARRRIRGLAAHDCPQRGEGLPARRTEPAGRQTHAGA